MNSAEDPRGKTCKCKLGVWERGFSRVLTFEDMVPEFMLKKIKKRRDHNERILREPPST